MNSRHLANSELSPNNNQEFLKLNLIQLLPRGHHWQLVLIMVIFGWINSTEIARKFVVSIFE